MTAETVSSFYKWLYQQQSRRWLIGDIATDVCRDLRFPKSISTKKEFLAYMALRTGDQGVLNAADAAYSEYAQSK